MALEPGKKFVVGFHQRGTIPMLPDAAAPMLKVYINGNNSVANTIWHLRHESQTFSPNSIIDWRLRILINSTQTQVCNIVNAYPDPMLNFPSTIATYLQTHGRDILGYHQYAVAARMSTYNTVAATYAADGYLALNVDGVTIFSSNTLTLPHRLIDGKVRIEFWADIDADAVWLTSGLAFPSRYDAEGRPTVAGLQNFWDFNTGITGWQVGFTPFFPGAYGVNRTGGISSWSADPAAGSLTGTFVNTHPSLVQTLASLVALPDCECPPHPEHAGGGGRSGGDRNEGADPYGLLQPWTVNCTGSGSVPTGTNGTDAETWSE